MISLEAEGTHHPVATHAMAAASAATHVCDHGRLWVSSSQVLEGAPPAAPKWWLPSDRRAARLRRRLRSLPPDEAVRASLLWAAGVDVDVADDGIQHGDDDADTRHVESVQMRADDPGEYQHQHRRDVADDASRANGSGDIHSGQSGKDTADAEADADQTVRRRAAASCCRAVLLGPPPLNSHAELVRRLEIVDELWRGAAGECHDRLQPPPRAGEQEVTGVNPSVEADAAVLSASALVGSPLPPQAKAAARRLACAVGDLWTVLPPSILELINADVARGVCSTHGDFVQAAAKAATTTTPTVSSASPRRPAHTNSKGGRRPEAPHGCVVVRDGVVLATGTNHTVPSIEAVEPHLREHIDALCGLVGDHRQWFRAQEARERSRASGNAIDSALERVSFHAEQHAVLRAVSAGDSLEGAEVYIAEVSEDGSLGEAFPCTVCLPLLVHHRVSLVHFTTPDGLRTLDLGGLTARAEVRRSPSIRSTVPCVRNTVRSLRASVDIIIYINQFASTCVLVCLCACVCVCASFQQCFSFRASLSGSSYSPRDANGFRCR